jgi:ABC-2 type transport system ATP-binding protein
VLLTTQYLNEADALADRVTFIDGGRVIARGSPAELKARIGDRPADLTRLMLAIERAGIEPVDYQVRTPSLDDVYFALTGHDHAEQPADTLEAAR